MKKLFGITSSILGFEITIWWLGISLFQTYALMSLGFTWQLSALDGFAFNAILILSSYVIRLVSSYYLSSFENRFYPFVAVVSLAALSVFAECQLLIYLIPNEFGFLQFIEKGMLIRLAFATLIIGFQLIMQQILNNVKDQNIAKERKVETENMIRDAELSKLRLQLQPHFLFNSLNSISALAGSRPDEARKMIQQLSDFLRGTLKKDDQKLVNLEEEVKHLNLYLEIEKVRFGHRLQTHFEISEAALNGLLPSLLLQPIVENAIKFGLYDTIGDIEIKIKARIESENILTIEVENPFDSTTSKANTGTGFGLNSIVRRLNLLYGRNDLLTTQQNNNTFTTLVKIPQSHV
jgi:two-component system, LytTR family, sensor kinase